MKVDSVNALSKDASEMIDDIRAWVQKLQYLSIVELSLVVQIMELEFENIFDEMDVVIGIVEKKRQSFKDILGVLYEVKG